MRVVDEIYYPMFLLLPLNLRSPDLDGIVESYKVLAICDPSMLLLSMMVADQRSANSSLGSTVYLMIIRR